MKRALILLLLLAMAIAGCTQEAEAPAASTSEGLVVTDGTMEKVYTVADLEALPATEASFREVGYVGVSLATLLEDAGFNPSEIRAAKAVAVDGFSANYEAELANQADTLVAYARQDGDLADDEKPLRMVLPDQEGKMNVRQLARIEVIP